MGWRDGSVQACITLVEDQSMVPIGLSHFSIAVERHYDQGNTMTGERVYGHHRGKPGSRQAGVALEQQLGAYILVRK